MTDEDYMRMALELAARGRGTTSPNPMVGAVVVADGAMVGSGYHRFAGGPHAEVYAIDAAGARARAGTLYVSLEPCTHTGRTPPCTRKILEAGIRRVVVGMRDPNPRAAGGAEVLRREGVEVTLGVCAAEAEELNEAFITHIRTGRPFVTAKCAATLDGRIATRTMDSKWVTGERARAYVHELRYAMDAILVGIGTVAADDPLLTARVGDRDPRDPVRIVLDATLRIDPAARVLNHGSAAETWVVAGRGVPAEARARIERRGVRVLEAETRDGLDRSGAAGGAAGRDGDPEPARRGRGPGPVVGLPRGHRRQGLFLLRPAHFRRGRRDPDLQRPGGGPHAGLPPAGAGPHPPLRRRRADRGLRCEGRRSGRLKIAPRSLS